MRSFAIKLTFCSAIILIMVYVINANHLGTDPNDRNKMSLNVQESNDDYSGLSNQALILDRIDKLGALVRPRVSSLDLPSGYVNQQKRQIRYHQCYFNPISCFRKRK